MIEKQSTLTGCQYPPKTQAIEHGNKLITKTITCQYRLGLKIKT
ncbi:Uncharacterized protein YP598_1541 [Yersinia pseudotuberculosis]|uniref:Uncharacterized protein n=1 Tax=Yersinia pseudotuberculosis serotype O:1b (strain IP 31758) TaxID=349747 RepID=A0A0U1R0G7_YERP3|nr:hypothetical protein YpsIP31758_1504 [Yersinia pseudotuberculosis IP 31758]UFA61162.1 Uncharacterized protein YP598_1541 [Yersinia pseudotuberculosis]